MKPIILLENDMHPEYVSLARHGKKLGATIMAVQNTLFVDSKEAEMFVDIINAHTKFPLWIPLFVRKRLVWLRKWVGHIIKYQTFRAGKSSRVLRRGCSGMRDADIQTYLCDRQKQIFLKNGVPADKLIYHQIFQKKPKTTPKKTITILVPSDLYGGVDRTTKEFIPYGKQLIRWATITLAIVKKYRGYRILMKFHPHTKNYGFLSELFHGLDKNIRCYMDTKYNDYCLGQAEAIYELPPALGTLLYQASTEYPYKKIYAVDIGNEMFGDHFRGYDNIKVITKI